MNVYSYVIICILLKNYIHSKGLVGLRGDLVFDDVGVDEAIDFDDRGDSCLSNVASTKLTSN